jgi:hypothetical protein
MRPHQQQQAWWRMVIWTWMVLRSVTGFTTNEQTQSTTLPRARSVAATATSNATTAKQLRRAIGRSATSRRQVKAAKASTTSAHNHRANGVSTKSAMGIPGQYIITFHNDPNTASANATILKVLGDARDYLMAQANQHGNYTTPLQADDMAEIEWIYHTPALSGATVSGVWSTPLLAFLQAHASVESVEPVRIILYCMRYYWLIHGLDIGRGGSWCIPMVNQTVTDLSDHALPPALVAGCLGVAGFYQHGLRAIVSAQLGLGPH